MTSIDPTTGLAQLLQRQVAGMAASRHPGTSPAGAGALPAPRLAGAAAERIRAIAPDDPQRRGKALRVFLECAMQQAFGPGAVNDPNFAPMLDAVQQQMGEDPDMARATEALADVLVEEAGR